MQSEARLSTVDTLKNNHFRFEAENRFCLAGYGATVLMLCVVYGFQIEPITLHNLVIYTLITLGFHLSVQALGMAGWLASNLLLSRNLVRAERAKRTEAPLQFLQKKLNVLKK